MFRKIAVIFAVLCLMIAAAALSEDGFTFRNGVTFGMTRDEVIATESNARYELDVDHTHGPVTFTKVEYEDVTENGARADLEYLFVDDKLAAIRLDYKTRDISYKALKDTFGKNYGTAAALDLAKLGNGVYAVDDDGRPERGAEAFVAGNIMIVLELDDDDIDVTFVDLNASYIK